MARIDYRDVLNELTELCSDLQDDVLQQLTYYRASVYKDETRRVIDGKLSQLKFIVGLLGDDEASDLFLDFEASGSCGNVLIAPGECLLTMRIADLFSNLSQRFADVVKQDPKGFNDRQMSSKIQKNRKKIVAACKHGSRQKHFFETL